MLVNTAPDSGAGEAAAWSLLQVSNSGTQPIISAVGQTAGASVNLSLLYHIHPPKKSCKCYSCDRFYGWVWIPGDFLSEGCCSCRPSEPWLLTVGAHRVQCCLVCRDGVERLAVSRGLLTCCRHHILLSSHADEVNLAKLSETSFSFSCSCFSWPNPSFLFSFLQTCLLLEGLFPLVCALCEEKLDCPYFAFEGELRPVCLFTCMNDDITCYNVTCGCSIDTVAEES